jgi:hypothetical protein
MIYSWSAGFDGYPPGSTFGSTMGEALRRYKKAFKERFEVEHSFIETVDPSGMTHIPPCTVVQSVESFASNAVTGALQFNEEDNELARDTGTGTVKFTRADHGDLDNLDAGATDHPQYIDSTGDTITGTHNIPEIEGMQTSLPGSPADADAVSIGQHPTSGESNHTAGCITSTTVLGLAFPVSKLDVSQASATPLSSGNNAINEGAPASMPVPTEGTGTLEIRSIDTDSDDYNALYNLKASTADIHVYYFTFGGTGDF